MDQTFRSALNQGHIAPTIVVKQAPYGYFLCDGQEVFLTLAVAIDAVLAHHNNLNFVIEGEIGC